jgi:hypothetical protein
MLLSSLGGTMAEAVGHRSVSVAAKFHPRPIHTWFVVGKVALKHLFSESFAAFPVNIIPPMLRIHAFICHRLNIKLTIDIFK